MSTFLDVIRIETRVSVAMVIAIIITYMGLVYARRSALISTRDRLQRNLHDSSSLRETIASKIADFNAGTTYYNALSTSLRFAQRHKLSSY